MLGLLPGELASAQSEFVSAFCDKSCSIERASGRQTPGTYGSGPTSRGHTSNYSQIATSVPVGLFDMTEAELANYNYLIEDKAAWHACFPLAQDVQVQDHVILENQTLEVHILLTPESFPMLLNAIVAELKP